MTLYRVIHYVYVLMDKVYKKNLECTLCIQLLRKNVYEI
jgi:hypothetical protein